MTLPLRAFGEEAFDEGLGFDGSSIRGWQGISESDMLLMPQAETATLDPFTAEPTLSVICEVARPGDPRAVCEGPAPDRRRTPRSYLLATGIADTAYFGPECEFFVFDSVAYGLDTNRSHYEVDSAEGHWNSGTPGPRLHGAPEGGLLPAGAARHAARPAHRDGADARAARHPVRVPPPRGRLRRPVRDRPALPDADAHGRPGAGLQVRRQEHRAEARQDGDVHAEADLRRQRLGHALPPVALEGRGRR